MKKEKIYEYKKGELRKLQMKSLEIYEVLLDFCKKNKLNVYFSGGCVIGTIRNKGFIPWDDDIDMKKLKNYGLKREILKTMN